MLEKTTEFRIWGPPGCGKTTSLSAQIQADAREWGEDAILTCTLTNAAANELGGRNLTLNPATTGTLHSICYGLLGRPPVAADPKLLARWNEHTSFPLSGAAVVSGDDGGETSNPKATRGDGYYHDYQIARVQMQPRAEWPVGVKQFAAEWEAWKHDEGAIDFVDMIERVLVEDLGPPEGVRAGFVDEAQDFDRLSLTLFRKWGTQLDRLVICGDDDQCLYTFRGSDPAALLDVPIPDEQVHILSQSYRVPRAVHDVSTAWIEQLHKRQPKPYQPRDADGAVQYHSATYKTPEDLLREVEAALDRGKTVLILAACGYMLNPLKAVLRQRGVPFHNPWRPTRGDWNPLGLTRGVSARERLLAFLAPDPALSSDSIRMMWTAEELKTWAAALKTDGVFFRGVRSQIEALSGSQEVTLTQLRSWLLPAAVDPALALDLDWFTSALLPSKMAGMRFPLTVAETQGPQALIDTPRLMIGTIHSCKGGEAQEVFLFPDLSPQAHEAWVMHDRDAIIRQFYVGLTRARETLTICEPATSAYVDGLIF